MPLCFVRQMILGLLASVLAVNTTTRAQQSAGDWRADVRKCADARDWAAAMRIVDKEITRAPQDLDARVWRARVLTWSGRLADAEQEYEKILKAAPSDPDNWVGLAGVYSREGRTQEALHALDRAVELDPKRTDIRAARGLVLQAAGARNDARTEFQRALALDPRNTEARAGLLSLRAEPKHELRFGQENDLFNFANANHDGWVSLVSQWSSHWTTNVAGSFYERGGTNTGKFLGSVTGRSTRWGALTAGGAAGHDNAIIPQSEAFFEYDHAWKVGEAGFFRGIEAVYGQHWYWYATARILTLNGSAVVYLPREWTWSLGLTGSRSHFSGTSPEWRPSGTTRLGFPIGGWGERKLGGNVFFAVGTENFGQVDQIGQFSSQMYGGGFRFQFTARQDVTGFAACQRRTQNRTETNFGFTYGIRF